MKTKQRRAGWWWAVVLACAASGCATRGTHHAYPGAQRDPAELATVLGTTNSNTRIIGATGERLTFMSVDGKSTVPWYSLAPYPTSIYVLPGRREVEIQYEYIHGVARTPLWVQAQSNRSYRVKVMNPEGRTERLYFVIEDVTAQTLVGGTAEQSK